MSATAMHVDGSNRTRRLSDGDPGATPACNPRHPALTSELERQRVR